MSIVHVGRWLVELGSGVIVLLLWVPLLLSVSSPFVPAAKSQPAASLEEANRLFESGDYKAAKGMYRDVMVQTTNVSVRGMATFNLGILLQRLQRHEEAVETFNQLLAQPVNDLEPGSHLMETYRNYRHRAQWEIGNCFFAKKEYTNALQAYTQSSEKYPLRSWCGTCSREQAFRYEYHVGLCLDQLGRTVEALKHYYRASLSGRMMASDPAVCFRLISIYKEAGQMAALNRLLDEIDAKFLAEIKSIEKGSGRQFGESELRQMKPTATVRRALELESWAWEGKRTELIKLLKIKNAVTGPPDDGNWEAVEAARLLALSPDRSVPELLAVADRTAPPDDRWVAYALARCGGTNAVAWIKQRALKEENGWGIRSFVYSLSLAGKDGMAALESAPALKATWAQLAREGRTAPSPPMEFPKVSGRIRLPAKLAEIE